MRTRVSLRPLHGSLSSATPRERVSPDEAKPCPRWKGDHSTIGDIVIRLDRIGNTALTVQVTKNLCSLLQWLPCTVSILLRLISLKGLGGAPQLMKMMGLEPVAGYMGDSQLSGSGDFMVRSLTTMSTAQASDRPQYTQANTSSHSGYAPIIK